MVPLCLILLVLLNAKKTKDFQFDLQEQESTEVPIPSLEQDNTILYIRTKTDSKSDALGQLELTSGDESNIIDSYYQTALFLNKISNVNLKCKSPPCVGRISFFSSEIEKIDDTQSTLELTQKQPVALVLMKLSSGYQRMVGQFNVIDDENDLLKIDVFEEKAELYGDGVQLTVAVSKNDCSKCQVYAVISADLKLKDEATITASLIQYKSTQSISLEQSISDFLFPKHDNTYELKLPQTQTNLLAINVLSVTLPHLTISTDDTVFDSKGAIAGLEGQSYFIYIRNLKSDNITISLKKGGPFKYSMKIILMDHDPLIYVNQIVLSNIEANQKQSYDFKIQNDQNEIAVNINYEIENENTINSGECNNNRCVVSNENTHNIRIKQDKRKPNLYLTPECQSRDNQGFCTFKIELQSNNNSLYLIQAGVDKQQISVKANTEYQSFISQFEQQNIIIKYQHQKDDVEMVFTVNSHNVIYFISQDINCYPVKRDCAKYIGGMDNLVTLRGEELKHTQYYVTLQSRQTTYFSLIAKITKVNEIDIKILKEDETYRGILELQGGKGVAHYFRLMIDLDKTEEGIEIIEINEQPTLELSIHSAKLQVGLTVNQGNTLPSISQYHYISMHNYLSITPNSPNYQTKGNYSITVENLHETFLSKSIPYTLTFSTSRTVKTLQIGQQYIDRIQPSRPKYFSFYYDLNTPILFINLQNTSNNKLTIIVKEELSNNGTSLNQNEHSSTIQLIQEDLYKLCGVDINDKNDEDDDEISLSGLLTETICQAYIKVENQGIKDQQYTLNVWSPNSGIELHEGQQYQFNLEHISKGISLYYKVISFNQDVQLHINSHFGYTNYTIHIINSQTNKSEPLYAQEGYKTQHSKSIYNSAFKECQSNCLIQIQLFSQFQEYNVERQIDFDDVVFVTVTQQYMELISGLPIQLQVLKFHPRRFIFNDLQGVSAQSRFKLILHEIYGKGAICISFADDDYSNFPDEECDYAVQGNVAELTQAQIQQYLQQLNITKNPIMIIEVQSLTPSSKFQISIEAKDDINNHKLILGVPSRIRLDFQEEVQYTYFNIATDDDIYFKFIKLMGTAQIEISRCLNDTSKICEQQIIVSEQLLAGSSFNQHILYSKDNSKYCILCTYTIKVKTFGISSEMLLIVTTQQNFVQLPQNIAFTDYLADNNDYNIYHYSFDTDHQIEISINHYNGDTEMWIGYNQNLNTSQYQFGPYNVNKQKSLMNTTQLINYYKAILPPREHLEQNDQKYNITPYANATHTLAGHYNDDDIYIIVKNRLSIPSNYSITVTQSTSGNGQLLQDGIITSASINRQTPKIVLYHQYKYNNQPSLFIKLFPIGVYNIPFENLIKVEYSNETNPQNFTQLTAHSIRNNQLNYILPLVYGMLTIQIHSLLEIPGNDLNVDYQFNPNGEIVPARQPFPVRAYQFRNNFINNIDLQINIIGKEVFMINQNSNQIDQMTNAESRFYETFIQQEGKIGIQVYNCLGDLNVSISQDYDQFLNRTYNASKITIEGAVTDIIIPVKQGPLFLDFTSDSKSVYKFTTKYYSQSDPQPFGSLLPGGDGTIKYQFNTADPDLIQISFKPLKCVGCDMHIEQNSRVNYKLIWGSSLEYAHVIGLCNYNQYIGLSSNDNNNRGEFVVGEYELNKNDDIITNITVDKQASHDYLYLSLIANIITYNGKQQGDYEIYYHVSQVGLPKNGYYMYKHRFYEFIVAVIIISIFLISMLCCLCSFYRKARKLKKLNLNLALEKQMQEAKEKKDRIEIKHSQFEDENENENGNENGDNVQHDG